MTDLEQIDQIMDDWNESRGSGHESTSHHLCLEYPHLLQELEKRIRAVQAIDALRLPRDASPTMTGAGATDTATPDGRATAPTAFAPPLRPGELGRLRDYRVLKRLGEGGMGTVYLAEHDGLKRLDALKVMKAEATTSPQAKERFLREARVAASVKHDHIVTIYHVGEDHGVPYIAMELLEGESLDERLKREPPLPPLETARIGYQIADGLAAAHSKGLIHRDIKPGNVWLSAQDHPSSATIIADSPTADSGQRLKVKILDFGLARPLESEVQITHAGTIVGSPAYMSPEQAAGLDLDGRSDLFSLGVVLYRMTTGRLPFHGANVLAILRQVESHLPAPPHTVNPAVPPALSELIMRLMAKARNDRPKSAAAVAGTLQAIARGNAPDLGSRMEEFAAAAGPKRRTGRRGWIVAAVAIAVVVPLLLVAGVAMVGAFGAYTALKPPSGNRGGPVANSGPPVATHAALEPLKGYIDILVWNDMRAIGPGRRINRIENVPLKPGEYMRIEVELNRPAYVYIIYLDTEGVASPMFPWTDQEDWNSRPAEEKPRQALSLPDGANTVVMVQGGPPGIESLLLLVRDEPLPKDFDEKLKSVFDGLPKQQNVDVNNAAWFRNGVVVRDELDRKRPNLRETSESDDPILQTQALLQTKLKEMFPYTRAVCFGNKGGR